MDQLALIELIFSTAPKLTALLLVVFTYALQRYEGVKGTNFESGYKLLIICVFGSIILSALCTFFSFLALATDFLRELMFYLGVGFFWSTLTLLIITCIFIITRQLK